MSGVAVVSTVLRAGCLIFAGWLIPAGVVAAAPQSESGSDPLEPLVLDLWPEGAPGAPIDAKPRRVVARGTEENPDRFTTDIHQPRLSLYLPEISERIGSAVLICPGGGYRAVAIDREGHDVARWLQGLGVSAAVLEYRLPRPSDVVYGHEVPLQDAERALEILAERADEWLLDQERIGVAGFSAGGHLAATLSVLSSRETARRPAFSILVYPVISMRDELTHQGSRTQLLGDEVREGGPGAGLIALFSADEQVDATTPPAFLVHASDDQVVDVRNSLRYYEALVSHAVPAEIHVFERGGHGFGLRRRAGPVATWPELLEQWLEQHGLLAREE